MRLKKPNQKYKNINNRVWKNQKKGRIIELLLFKIKLLKWLTKPTCSGIKIDNLGVIHYYCLECLWSIIMKKRNQLNQKTKIRIKKS